MDLEFGRRGEDVCERLQKVGQSQTHCSASGYAAQTYSSRWLNVLAGCWQCATVDSY